MNAAKLLALIRSQHFGGWATSAESIRAEQAKALAHFEAIGNLAVSLGLEADPQTSSRGGHLITANAAVASERERLAEILFAEVGWDRANEVADVIIAAGFQYSPPPAYHCCTPGCDPLCDIQETLNS